MTKGGKEKTTYWIEYQRVDLIGYFIYESLQHIQVTTNKKKPHCIVCSLSLALCALFSLERYIVRLNDSSVVASNAFIDSTKKKTTTKTKIENKLNVYVKYGPIYFI